jgi:hypothetical protein
MQFDGFVLHAPRMASYHFSTAELISLVGDQFGTLATMALLAGVACGGIRLSSALDVG